MTGHDPVVPISLPRSLFLKAADRSHWHQDSPKFNAGQLTVEVNRRHRLIDDVRNAAQDLLRIVDTVRTFDRAGHVDDVVPALESAALDALTRARLLATEVDKAAERYESLERRATTTGAMPSLNPLAGETPTPQGTSTSPASAPTPASVFGGVA